MSPLDALTQARIRSLEIVLAWLIGQSLNGETPPGFILAAEDPNYMLDFADKLAIASEEEDA